MEHIHVLQYIAIHIARIVWGWFGEPGLVVCWLGGFALWLLLWVAHVQTQRRRPAHIVRQRDSDTAPP